jgi:hypothetical protein
MRITPSFSKAYFLLTNGRESWLQVEKEREKYVFGPSRFFGIHLVPQVSKPDKCDPKPDFDRVKTAR